MTEAQGETVVSVLPSVKSGGCETDDQSQPLLTSHARKNPFSRFLKQRTTACVRCYWDNYVWLILSASVGYALMLLCIKILSERASVFQITACLCKPRDKMPLIIARAVMGSVAFVFMAIATIKLPLSESAFMANSYPALTAVLSWMFGMEHLGLLSWSGVFGCVLGNAIMAHPPFLFGGGSEWEASRVIGLVSAVAGNCLTAAAFLLLRYIGKSVDSSLLTAYMHLFSVFVSIPFLAVKSPELINWHPVELDWLWYAITGLLGIFAQVVQSRALQIGPPTKATSLLMTNMLLTGFIGVTALHESMSWMSGIGAGVVVISVMLVTMQSSPKAATQQEEYQPLVITYDSEISDPEV